MALPDSSLRKFGSSEQACYKLTRLNEPILRDQSNAMDELERKITEAFWAKDSKLIIECLDERPSMAAMTNWLNQDVFWLAAREGMVDIVRHLVENPKFHEHLYILRMDHENQDAFDIAEDYGHADILEYLQPILGVDCFPDAGVPPPLAKYDKITQPGPAYETHSAPLPPPDPEP